MVTWGWEEQPRWSFQRFHRHSRSWVVMVVMVERVLLMVVKRVMVVMEENVVGW